jgi:hypothetical protein
MAGGGGTQESKTTTEISPDFKPFITYGLQQARGIYEATPEAPETLAVGPSAATQTALGMAEQRAMAGSPLLRQAQGTISRQMGFTSPYAGRIENLGMTAADPSGAFYQSMMAGGSPTEAQEMARRTASGAFLEPSPFLQGALSQANRLATESYQEGLRGLQSQASAARRYGSGAMGQLVSKGQDVFARALTEQNQQAFLQNYMREREAQENAIGRLGAMEQQALANRFAGASGLTAGQQQALQTQLGALGAAQDITAADLARQQQAASMAPGLAAQDYADIQRLLQVGQGREGYDQRAIQGQLAAQEIPMQRLQQAANVFYGAPLETTTTQQATPQGGK